MSDIPIQSGHHCKNVSVLTELCIYVCIYLYVYIYMYTYMYMCVRMCMYTGMLRL